MATIFWLSMGYNFSCVIASGTIFDSRGGFSGLIYGSENHGLKTEKIFLKRAGKLCIDPIFNW